MEGLLRFVAVAALSLLGVGTLMYATGAELADQRFSINGIELTRISPYSPFVRAVYERRLGNDADSMGRAAAVLAFAGQSMDARLLERFFEYCSVQRFLGRSDACTGETVRSAVEKAAAFGAPVPGSPVEEPLASQLEGALSFSLAPEQLMRTSAASDPGFETVNKFDGPGLIIRRPGFGVPVQIILAARNRSPWEITAFAARIALPSSGAAPIELECSESPWPLQPPGPFTPGSRTIVGCGLPGGNAKLDDVLDAIHVAQRQDSLSGRLEKLYLKDPPVEVAIEYNASTPALTVYPLGGFDGSGPDPSSISDQVAREIRNASCAETGSCPSRYDVASSALFGFFRGHLLWVPVIAGLLSGVSFGALFRGARRVVGVFVGIVLVGTGVAAGYVIHGVSASGGEGAGYAGLALAEFIWYGGLALALAIPTFFVGVALMRPLRELAESDS